VELGRTSCELVDGVWRPKGNPRFCIQCALSGDRFKATIGRLTAEVDAQM
jgi:hypothetical protein